MEAKEEGITLLGRYPFTCPVCAKEWDAGPSLGMLCGDNNGCARCSSCQTFLHLEIVPDLSGTEMRAEEFNAYLDRIQGVQNAQ